MQVIKVERSTAETQVVVELRPFGERDLVVDTGVPFFDHMLHALLFHGGFGATITARGDIEVDDHHTVEDVGIVLGQTLWRVHEERGPLARFGSAVVPMDDALAETVVDLGGRPFMVFTAEFPQAYAGRFDLALVREFFQSLATHSRANIHVHGRYGVNGHHLAEAMFKSCGRALAQACTPVDSLRSTKGSL